MDRTLESPFWTPMGQRQFVRHIRRRQFGISQAYEQSDDLGIVVLRHLFSGRLFVTPRGPALISLERSGWFLQEKNSGKGRERTEAPMAFFILTNNPRVDKLRGEGLEVLFTEASYIEVLRKARDLVHQGHCLLTHPLSGSVKPGETPYKSIMLSKERAALDPESLELIENAVTAAEKFPDKSRFWSAQVLEDFALVDLTLISSAFPSAQ